MVKQIYRQPSDELDVRVAMDIHLLDFLARTLHCDYLSDLKFLSDDQQQILSETVAGIQPGSVTLREWNDTLQYLTGSGSMDTQEGAKQSLIRNLQRIDRK